MTQTQRPFELAWIPPGTAAPNPDQYVEHPNHQLDALRGILYGEGKHPLAASIIPWLNLAAHKSCLVFYIFKVIMRLSST